MSRFSDMIDKVAKGEKLDEVSPPGFKGTVKSLKKRHSDEVDNPYALAWWMKNKGYKSSKKASGGPKNEAADIGIEMKSGLGQWINDWKEAKSYGNLSLANKIERNIQRAVIEKGLDPVVVDREMYGDDTVHEATGSGRISDMDASGIAQRTWGPNSFQDIQKRGSGWMVLAGPNDPLGFIQQNGNPMTFDRETGTWNEADGAGGGGSSGMTSQIEGGGNGVFTGMEPGAYQDILSAQPEIEPDLDEETGDNYSQTSGTGSPYSPWYQENPTDTFPTENEGKSTLAASVGNGTNYPTEEIRVDHPIRGRGTVIEINDSDIVVEWDNLQLSLLGPERLKISEGKYLFRVKENYSDDPDDVEVGKKKKKKKKGVKVDETGPLATTPGEKSSSAEWNPRMSDDPEDSPTSPEYIAPGGLRGIVNLGVIDSMKDKAHRNDKRHKSHKKSTLLGEGKMTKKKIDEHMMAIPGMFVGSAREEDRMNIDLSFDDLMEYELPEPSDSVLTNQTAPNAPKVAPLSTERGADAAGDGGSPDGDYATDLVPDDAPDIIKYDAMGDEAGNTRDSGDASMGADTGSTNKKSSGESTGDSDSSSGEYNFTKKENKKEDADDDGEDDDMKESILTWEDLGLVAEEYDEDMDECGCGGGGEESAEEKPKMGMGMMEDGGTSGEVAMTKELLSKLVSAIKDQAPDDEACEDIINGLVDAGGGEGRTLDVGDISMIMDAIKASHANHSEDSGEMEVGNEPEPEHDGGMQVDDEMDSPTSVGDESNGNFEYEDKAEGDGERAGPEGGEEHEGKTKLMDKKGRMKEGKGGSKPISQNTSKGSGPGGGNTGEFGQKDGTVKQVKKGKETGVPGAPLSKEGGGKTVPPISESRIDEQMVAVAMAGIGSVYRGGAEHENEMDALTEEQKELAMIKRRAGLENWWKV